MTINRLIQTELKEERNNEKIYKDVKSLEIELESLRIIYKNQKYPSFVINELITKLSNLKIPANSEDPYLRIRIDNSKDEIAILKLKESLAKLLSFKSIQSENKIAYLKSTISNLNKLLLSVHVISELKRSYYELKLAKGSFSRITQKNERTEQHKWILENQIRLVREKLDLNDFIARTVYDYKKCLQKEMLQQNEHQLNHFKDILKAIYLMPHNMESLDRMKESLSDFVEQATQYFQSVSENHPKNTLHQLAMFTKLQSNSKINSSDQKHNLNEGKTEYKSALILAKALLGELEKVEHLSKKPRDLKIDVCPALYFAINWDNHVLSILLSKKAQKNRNTDGITKLIMHKHAQYPNVGWDDFLKSFKNNLGEKTMNGDQPRVALIR